MVFGIPWVSGQMTTPGECAICSHPQPASNKLQEVHLLKKTKKLQQLVAYRLHHRIARTSIEWGLVVPGGLTHFLKMSINHVSPDV